jgi:hypothetical protein
VGVTLYVCSKCKGVCSIAWGSPDSQLCRACYVASRGFSDYARSEEGRVGKATELVTVVFPGNRVVKMNVNAQNEIEVQDSSVLDRIMTFKRKFREDIAT